jgi:hypothetical protein
MTNEQMKERIDCLRVTNAEIRERAESAEYKLKQAHALLDSTAASMAEAKASDLAAHRKLASETLRADQGWQRYEEKNREVLRLREMLASRPAVDSTAIVDHIYEQDGFKSREALAADVQVMLSGRVEYPHPDCDKACHHVCTEGRTIQPNCAQPVPSAMDLLVDGIIPHDSRNDVVDYDLRGTPITRGMVDAMSKASTHQPDVSKSGGEIDTLPVPEVTNTIDDEVAYTADQMRTYAEQARADALEEAAMLCEQLSHGSLGAIPHYMVCRDRIRALNKKG